MSRRAKLALSLVVAAVLLAGAVLVTAISDRSRSLRAADGAGRSIPRTIAARVPSPSGRVAEAPRAASAPTGGEPAAPGAVAPATSSDSTASAEQSGDGGFLGSGRAPLELAGGPAEVRPLPVGDTVAQERARQTGISLTPSGDEPYWACPQGICEAIVDPAPIRVDGHWALPDGGRLLEGSGEKGGFDPQDLWSAYKIPTSSGEKQERYEATQTIALVDAGYDATAESDLEAYRQHYGLKPCTHTGGCFRQVNERGEEGNPPPPNAEWELETSLDLDMASAGCPHCHILLVEATQESLAALAEAANTAAELGATQISNSYGLPEAMLGECGTTACRQLNSDYDHPGVVVTASAGDGGYDNSLRGGTAPLFPAASPYVIAVGGTSLHKATTTRGWSEEVWEESSHSAGTGSGCSATQLKPAWQADKGCAHRTDNDVAAVAACETPISIYGTHFGGWEDVCGTSASAPLVAGIEAHASEAGGPPPTANAFYKNRSTLFNVTKGHNGTCSPEYLCSAESQEGGYDGPIGNGTPAAGPVETATSPPTARTEPASSVTGGQATLNGLLDPNGAETTYQFEYGTSTSYGTSIPASPSSAGSGAAAKAVSASVTGVAPGTTYHYRLVATNSSGTIAGEDQSFRTAKPTVTGVGPVMGSAGGGTQVTISGTNLTGATAVRFGQRGATSVQVQSEGSLTATAPPGAGIVDVTVTTPAGTSPTGTADRFLYYAFGPTFTLPATQLTFTGASGNPHFGEGLAMSADGNTALVGGATDNSSHGAAWVFTHSGSSWAQQGEKLTGPGATESADFGESLALSSNGNTALIGAPGNSHAVGAAWVFTRSGGVWTEQAKLTGSGESGAGDFGFAVSLSADGNTALIGGVADGEAKGAAWVFTRSGSTWTQQGSKLTGGSEGGAGDFGFSVSLSGEGNTALIGGPADTTSGVRETGAAWVFTRSGSTWTPQGGKLTPVGAVGPSQFGFAVQLSSEASTAIVTGDRDAEFMGAAWVFTRTGSTWTQQGGKLTTIEHASGSSFGYSAGLSSEGNTALLGSGTGVWLFRRVGSSWTQRGPALIGSGELGTTAAISGEGTTALVGARSASPNGAAYILATPLPAVTKIEPATGSPSGGTTVTVKGARLSGASAVRFGSTPARHFEVLSEGEIKAVSPSATGTVNVTVETAAGATGNGSSDLFSYEAGYWMQNVLAASPQGTVPSGLAVNSQGDVWVSEWWANQVVELSPGGALIRQLAVEAPCSGSLLRPYGLALDGEGNLWVADSENGRLLKFSAEGKCEDQLGSKGSGNGQLAYPTGVTVGPNGDIWVADMYNQRVQELTPSGEFVTQLGSPGTFGSSPGELLLPEGVAVAANGDVWVSEPFNGRVQEFSGGGAFLGSIAAVAPEGEAVAANSSSDVWVADGSDTVREYGPGREPLAQLGSPGLEQGELEGVDGVALGLGGSVWVAERSQRLIEEWLPG